MIVKAARAPAEKYALRGCSLSEKTDNPTHTDVRAIGETGHRTIVDPKAVNAWAFAGQQALILGHDGFDAVRKREHPSGHTLDRKLF